MRLDPLLLLFVLVALGGRRAVSSPPLLWIAGIEKTGARFRAELAAVAARLGIDPNHLAAAISVETVATFSPSIRNPLSDAIGLIQFLPTTAKQLGTTTAELAAMSDVEQLAYVEKYFRRAHTGPLARAADVYLAIFAPAFIGKPVTAVMFEAPAPAYEQNKGYDYNRDGKITVAEATLKVRNVLEDAIKRGPAPPPAGELPSSPGPAPVGPTPGKSLAQGEVTPAMTQWAIEVLHGPLPIGATTGPRTFASSAGAAVDVIARVEWHPPDPPVGPAVWHRGVGLYHTPGTVPATAPPAQPGGVMPGPTPTVYRSQAAAVHPSGWVSLASGVEITRLPLIDENGLFCRFGAADAAAILAHNGMRLPTAAELIALHGMALHVEPVTLPTKDMLIADGVPPPWIDAKGKDTPQMAAYRASRMSSRQWCELHDSAVTSRLQAAHWSGQPVANAGKHWTNDGGIVGWWLAGGGQIQGLSWFHEPSGKPTTPPKGTHTDYATTIHAVRKPLTA